MEYADTMQGFNEDNMCVIKRELYVWAPILVVKCEQLLPDTHT